MKQEKFLTEKRIERLKSVVAKRQFDLTVVLENIHDPHNIAAVLRSCDAIGISEIYVIITDPRINLAKYEAKNNNASSGSQKWVQIHLFTDVNTAVTALRQKYTHILGTHLDSDARSLYDLDLTQSTALVFGNEHEGITKELLEQLDGNFIIPQFGMVQSLNISVACAVSVFEASRQRQEKGAYQGDNWTDAHQELYEKYVRKSKPKLQDI